MRKMSALDVYFSTLEMKNLENCFIQKAYQDGKVVRLELYRAEVGSFELYFDPEKIFVTEYKREAPLTPEAFCMRLRKVLKGQKVMSIKQYAFERIVELKTENNILIFEMFSKGNAILCDAEYKIIMALEVQLWKDRQIVPGKKYEYPPAGINPYSLDMTSLGKALLISPKQLVIFLATEFGFGGLYAEEICMRAQIEKTKTCSSLNSDEIMVIYEAMHSLVKKFEPRIIYEGSEIFDAIPFEMEYYRGKTFKTTNTFIHALDEYYMQNESKAIVQKIEKVKEDQLGKMDKTIDKQRNAVETLTVKEEECRKKAELINNNYDIIENIISEMNSLKNSGLSWKEIKDKMKENPKVKTIKEEHGKIILDL